MGKVIAWTFLTGILFMTTLLFSDLMLSTGEAQHAAHQHALDVRVEQLRTGISIDSVALDVVTVGSGKCASSHLEANTLMISNTGEVAFADLSEMDLFATYTGDTGSAVTSRLEYVTGSLSEDKWKLTDISPDNTGVNIWDPQEVATLRWWLDPSPQPSSLGTVTMSTPQGVTASEYVNFDFGSNDCRYLHNNPTPPTADTNLQAVLPIDKTAPTAATLYNYDQDVDLNAGRTIGKGGLGVEETDPKKYQDWRTGVLSEPLTLSGTITVDIWAAIHQYQLDKAGIVNVYFRDYDGSTYTEVGDGAIFDTDWQGNVSDFVRKVGLFLGFNYTVPAGNELEVKITVGNLASAGMWFAYDTAAHQSLVNLSYQEPTYTTFYYLHNSPTPPTGDTNAQSPLPMDATASTSTTLYNYDQNYDADPGRTLQKTTLGVSTSQLQKHQVWRSGALGSALAIIGDVKIDLWAAIANYDQAKTGIVTVYLRDYDGVGHQEIGRASAYADDWQDGSTTWVGRSIIVPELDYTVPTGNEVEIFMVVENLADSAMWFAYDTTTYPTVLKIP